MLKLRYGLFMFNKEDIKRYFTQLNDLAKADDVLLELDIYGGVAFMLAYDMRAATKDVAWKNAAKEIADSIYRKADGFDPSKKSIAKSIEKEFSKRGIRSVKDKKLSFDNILRHGLEGWNRPRK